MRQPERPASARAGLGEFQRDFEQDCGIRLSTGSTSRDTRPKRTETSEGKSTPQVPQRIAPTVGHSVWTGKTQPASKPMLLQRLPRQIRPPFEHTRSHGAHERLIPPPVCFRNSRRKRGCVLKRWFLRCSRSWAEGGHNLTTQAWLSTNSASSINRPLVSYSSRYHPQAGRWYW